jgi:hypothetical protein
MRNPWIDLPTAPPFVLADDREQIARFNHRANEITWIHEQLLPEPFLGDPCAPVVLLNLNPGFSTEDEKFHTQAVFSRASRMNLAHKASEYPFYLLSPDVEGPGRQWWQRRLAPLLKVASRQVVAKRICCIEYFPYHTRKFRHRGLRVPSQDYSFHLVREAIHRDAIIVLMRSHRLWYEAIDELRNHDRLYTLRSVQNTVMSRKNCPNGFEVICSTLGAVESTNCG